MSTEQDEQLRDALNFYLASQEPAPQPGKPRRSKAAQKAAAAARHVPSVADCEAESVSLGQAIAAELGYQPGPVLRSIQNSCLTELLAGLNREQVRADLVQAGQRWVEIRASFPAIPDSEFFRADWRRIALLEEGVIRRREQPAVNLPQRKPPRVSQRTFAKRRTPPAHPLATLGSYNPAKDHYTDEDRVLVAELMGKARRNERLTDEDIERLHAINEKRTA